MDAVAPAAELLTQCASVLASGAFGGHALGAVGAGVPLPERRRPTSFTMAQTATRQQTFDDMVVDWEDTDWKANFRLSREAFAEMLQRCEHLLVVQRDDAKPVRGGCSGRIAGPLEPAVVLAAGLRFAAGGARQDIAGSYGIGKSTVYTCFNKVVDAINAHPDFRWPLHDALDRDDAGDPSGLDEISRHFSRASKFLLNGCVGACAASTRPTSRAASRSRSRSSSRRRRRCATPSPAQRKRAGTTGPGARRRVEAASREV